MNAFPETASQWFKEASRAYVENHQGCPSCCHSHCVTRHDSEEQELYYCQNCDFQACHMKSTDTFDHVPGVGEQDSLLDRVFDFQTDEKK